MKTYLLVIVTIMLCNNSTKAEMYYPFVEACSYEIIKHCADVSDYSLPDCMIEHEKYLNESCFTAFMEYDRNRWTTWDLNAYELWYAATPEERALYRKINWEEMKQRESSGQHGNFPRKKR